MLSDWTSTHANKSRRALYDAKRRITMADELTVNSATSGGAANYPWLKQYASYVPPELPIPAANGLAMFLDTAKNLPNQAAIYYFDQSMNYAELDRKSTAFGAALQEQSVVAGDRVALYLQN